MSTPLFNDTVPMGQHVRLVVDLIPLEMIDQEQGAAMVDAVGKGLAEAGFKIPTSVRVDAHHFHNCTEEKCGQNLRSFLDALDKQGHEAEGTEH